MSNEARKHTQTRKITAEKYSENKIHTLCFLKKITYEVYTIWVNMSDLQKSFRYSKFMSFTNNKKIKNYCKIKDQVKKYKRN